LSFSSHTQHRRKKELTFLFTRLLIFDTIKLIYNTHYLDSTSTSNNSKITDNIKKIQKQNRCLQDKLSKFADVTYNTIIKIESRVNKNPSIKTLSKIAKALGVGVNDLIK
jgi:DNA-binding XRE family transcriptional regulator